MKRLSGAFAFLLTLSGLLAGMAGQARAAVESYMTALPIKSLFAANIFEKAAAVMGNLQKEKREAVLLKEGRSEFVFAYGPIEIFGMKEQIHSAAAVGNDIRDGPFMKAAVKGASQKIAFPYLDTS
ncbi:hypothetical protein GKZ89_15070 [Bacillus mangrovi]|uniref:Uncharacterized protein n=1 Tax=Metabacillus mangrovi TaxID=1491830 RepID=A0A7X2S6U1_9BACI|nr:hypothetical protein [Metabacillus mangrovi]MTH54723.1 hypothetical protein [Metabacillus mangrovi]